MQLNRLQSKMEIAHVRPEDLATKTGLSISTIMKARRGGSITLGTATLIAQGMKMKKEDLI